MDHSVRVKVDFVCTRATDVVGEFVDAVCCTDGVSVMVGASEGASYYVQ